MGEAPVHQPALRGVPNGLLSCVQHSQCQAGWLWTLRENQSTVIIALDLYNAKLPAQQEGGIEAECIAWFESWREQASQAAEANGAHFVSLQDIFNGETHDLDPTAAGLTGPSDADPGAPIWRSTPTGAALHAEALITATLEVLSQR